MEKDTYEKLPDSNKLDVLFDLAQENHKCGCETQAELIELKHKFDLRKKFDTSVAGVAVIIGGFAAQVGSFILRGK